MTDGSALDERVKTPPTLDLDRSASADDADSIPNPFKLGFDTSDKWKTIFKKPEAPTCDVHGEPCIQLITKKSGINEGRAFWICSRYILNVLLL